MSTEVQRETGHKAQIDQFCKITEKMSTRILTNISKIRHFSSAKRNFTGGIIVFNEAKAPSSTASIPNVQGLSQNVVKVPNEPVGPGK